MNKLIFIKWILLPVLVHVSSFIIIVHHVVFNLTLCNFVYILQFCSLIYLLLIFTLIAFKYMRLHYLIHIIFVCLFLEKPLNYNGKVSFVKYNVWCYDFLCKVIWYFCHLIFWQSVIVKIFKGLLFLKLGFQKVLLQLSINYTKSWLLLNLHFNIFIFNFLRLNQIVIII